MTKPLKYLTIRGNSSQSLGSLSLSPKTSDQVDNQVILNALVATLVKYGQTGKLEPYLASSWEVSSDSLTWTFNLKSGFTCESGEAITAVSFANGLKNAFKGNISKSDNTEFNKLVGWKEFIDGSGELKGLTTSSNSLKLQFKSAPEDILNFLRMPYFGLWCNGETVTSDFDVNKFKSSGAYKIDKILAPHLIRLAIRKDQPTYHIDAPEFVEVGSIGVSDIPNNVGPTIYKLVNDGNEMQLPSYKSISSPPAIFQGIVLHPNTKFFGDIKNRKAFAARFEKFLAEQKTFNVSPGMYLDSPRQKHEVQLTQFSGKSDRPLKIAFQYRSPFDQTKKFWHSLFESVFEGIEFEIVYPDPSNPSWIRNMINNPDFDLRTAHVYAGTTYEMGAIKMMFCSGMGIAFPDVNKSMCKLVDQYENKGASIDEKFKARFEEILKDDSTLFPIYHANDQWLISPEIVIESMPTSIIYPLFENVRIRRESL